MMAAAKGNDADAGEMKKGHEATGDARKRTHNTHTHTHTSIARRTFAPSTISAVSID